MPVSTPNPRRLIRPLVHRLHAYVPGEQPRIKGLIKLNTNENPYPPSPEVLAAIRAAVDGRLRLYPNPTAQALREKLAQFHDCDVENIIVGNGSDELLMLAVRTFVEPAPSPAQRPIRPHEPPSAGARARGGEGGPDPVTAGEGSVEGDRTAVQRFNARGTGAGKSLNRRDQSRSTVQYFTPSYSLYPVLADIHGARKNTAHLTREFDLPDLDVLETSRAWDYSAALTFVTTPNAPSGRCYPSAALDALCRRHQGVVVLDEAYVDFAENHALKLALKHPHVLVARTFSKAYSLCFQRVGYFVGHEELIAALDKLRDSYNVNGLGQVAAQATLENLPYYRANFARVKATRRRLTDGLTARGFEVVPSATNFLLVRPPGFPARDWLRKLRDRKILVRWFDRPGLKQYLRITVGTDAEADTLLRAVRMIHRVIS